MSSSSPPPPPDVGQQLGSAINALNTNSGALVSAEQATSPALSQLSTQNNLNSFAQLSNQLFNTGGFADEAQQRAMYEGNANMANQAGQLGRYLPSVTAALNASNPYASGLQSAAQGSQFLGAGENNMMRGLAGLQANLGSSMNPTLSDVSQTMTRQGSGINPGFLGLGGAMAGSAILPGNQGPGSLSSGTQQLVDTTMGQLSLGGAISPQEQDMVAQASRSADNARGIFNSNASSSSELLNLDQFSQNRLMQRENQAAGAQGIANSQLQQNITNAQNAYQGASGILNTGLQAQMGQLGLASTSAAAGEGLQLQGLQGAAGTQAAGLSQMFNQNNAGLNQLAYLAGLGQNNTSSALNFINSNSGASGAQAGMGYLSQGMGTMFGSQANGNPSTFNSLGLFPAAHDDSTTSYNARFASQEQNAQASNSLMGAGIGAGIGIIGSVGAAIF